MLFGVSVEEEIGPVECLGHDFATATAIEEERLEVGVDPLDVLPGRRNQHPQCARQFDASSGKKLQHVVEA